MERYGNIDRIPCHRTNPAHKQQPKHDCIHLRLSYTRIVIGRLESIRILRSRFFDIFPSKPQFEEGPQGHHDLDVIQQAGRRLQRLLFTWMRDQGYQALDDSDPCVFVRELPDGEIVRAA